MQPERSIVSFRFTSCVRALQALIAASFLFAAASTAIAQDPLTKLRAEYVAQINPVDKAKTLAKLAPREMAAARDFSKDGDNDKALAALGKYRDEVMATAHALIATGVDASRHSAGFRELQISLRMFGRKLDDLILSLQQDDRPAFRSLGADFDAAQNELIDALFPAKLPKRPDGAGSQ
jgi:hypothetical protein